MSSEKIWPTEAVIMFCGAQLMCACAGGLLAGLLGNSGLAAFKLPDGFGAVVLCTLAFQGATWGLIAVLLWFYRWDWRDFFGLRDPQLGRALRLAGVAVAVSLPVLAVMDGFCGRMLEHFGYHTVDETAVQLVRDNTSIGGRLYMIAFAVLLAPVAEEFIFRGMLFSFLKQRGFPRTAWVAVNLFFALIHANAVVFLPLFVLALVLTWLYVKTGNLLAPITAHALFNGANIVWISAFDNQPAAS